MTEILAPPWALKLPEPAPQTAPNEPEPLTKAEAFSLRLSDRAPALSASLKEKRRPLKHAPRHAPPDRSQALRGDLELALLCRSRAEITKDE